MTNIDYDEQWKQITPFISFNYQKSELNDIINNIFGTQMKINFKKYKALYIKFIDFDISSIIYKSLNIWVSSLEIEKYIDKDICHIEIDLGQKQYQSCYEYKKLFEKKLIEQICLLHNKDDNFLVIFISEMIKRYNIEIQHIFNRICFLIDLEEESLKYAPPNIGYFQTKEHFEQFSQK